MSGFGAGGGACAAGVCSRPRNTSNAVETRAVMRDILVRLGPTFGLYSRVRYLPAFLLVSLSRTFQESFMTRQVSALLTAAAAAAVFTTFHAHAASQECEFHVSPVFIDAGVAAQTGTITIQTDPGCAWTAQVTPFGG